MDSLDPSLVGPDTLLRLSTAARLAFPDGSITLSSLRREVKRGRLNVFKVAGKYMTTLAEISKMVERCRVDPRNDHRLGVIESSEVDAARSLAAARLSVMRLREALKNGLPPFSGVTVGRGSRQR